MSCGMAQNRIFSNFRVFGCFAFRDIVPKDLRNQVESESTAHGVFVGFVEDSKGYRLWNPSGRKIIIATDVEFNEDTHQ
jgi:hypothetical protein